MTYDRRVGRSRTEVDYLWLRRNDGETLGDLCRGRISAVKGTCLVCSDRAQACSIEAHTSAAQRAGCRRQRGECHWIPRTATARTHCIRLANEWRSRYRRGCKADQLRYRCDYSEALRLLWRCQIVPCASLI